MLRKAQVVFTLTQFPSVTSVVFLKDGAVHGTPLGRSDYDGTLPPIVVGEPSTGQRVTNPVRVSGSANVSEATVTVRILHAGGREIATLFTNATCGSGCRGRFSVDVPYTVTTEQRGTVEVYEVSPDDGARTHVVSIPVVLTP